MKTLLLNCFNYCILDDKFDDILWLKFWNPMSSFCVCVCYLPPDGKTRLNDAEQFYTTLTELVYQYQNEASNIYICGDVNSRCGETADYIEGVDDVSEREVIDFSSNHYGDLLLSFLIDCNFCMLNSRVNGKNDFTHVSHHGRSVVDYVLVPHEQIRDINSLNVYRMSETIEHFKQNGCEKVPDHSILIWESEIIPLSSASDRNEQNAFTSRKLFNVSNIPTDFLNNKDAANLIHRAVE